MNELRLVSTILVNFTNMILVHTEKLTTQYLHAMFVLENLHHELYKETCRLSIKLELFRRAYGTHAVFARYEPPDNSRIMKRYLSKKRCIKSEFLFFFIHNV